MSSSVSLAGRGQSTEGPCRYQSKAIQRNNQTVHCQYSAQLLQISLNYAKTSLPRYFQLTVPALLLLTEN